MLLMNKAIIWDLLGTLGGDSQTLINSDFVFFDKAVPALQKATENGYLNIVITNQSHISHDRMTLEEYNYSLQKLLNELENQGVKIAEVYTCPHARKDNCNCKKPLPLLVEKAIKKYDLDPKKCYVVGDSGKNDMLLAKNSGMKSVLVLTGEGVDSLTNKRSLWNEMEPTHIADDCLDAIEKIIFKQVEAL